MEATITNAKVIDVTPRESTDSSGKTTAFLAITIFDGQRPQKLWAFAEDIPSPPSTGDTVHVRVTIRAKNGQYGPYLSIRARDFASA